MNPVTNDIKESTNFIHYRWNFVTANNEIKRNGVAKIGVTRSDPRKKTPLAMINQLFPSGAIQRMLEIGYTFKMPIAKELTDDECASSSQ